MYFPSFHRIGIFRFCYSAHRLMAYVPQRRLTVSAEKSGFHTPENTHADADVIFAE